MKNGNHAKGFNKKSIALVAAVALMLVGVVGGTIAWLTDTTPVITNTFTTSTVGVTLDESDKLDLQMIPGKTITKDPVVTVDSSDVAVYVFVEVIESDNFGTYMDYDMADDWTLVEGTTNVYYTTVAKSAEATDIHVLANDQVTVNTGVTKADMTAAETNAPTLGFKAYVVQQDAAADAAGAWAIAKQST